MAADTAVTAAATITVSKYLGRFATVMDAELLGVAMAWRLSETAITDSQAAIGCTQNLQFSPARSWIEGQVLDSSSGANKSIMWVRGHSGVAGSELADYKAKEGVALGRGLGHRETSTPAGARHKFRISWKTPWTMKWDR